MPLGRQHTGASPVCMQKSVILYGKLQFPLPPGHRGFRTQFRRIYLARIVVTTNANPDISHAGPQQKGRPACAERPLEASGTGGLEFKEQRELYNTRPIRCGNNRAGTGAAADVHETKVPGGGAQAGDARAVEHKMVPDVKEFGPEVHLDPLGYLGGLYE